MSAEVIWDRASMSRWRYFGQLLETLSRVPVSSADSRTAT